ncbi:MAG: hypothetical protein OXG69_06060 [bacterium]|nr:hypothetical protein [bacterium]
MVQRRGRRAVAVVLSEVERGALKRRVPALLLGALFMTVSCGATDGPAAGADPLGEDGSFMLAPAEPAGAPGAPVVPPHAHDGAVEADGAHLRRVPADADHAHDHEAATAAAHAHAGGLDAGAVHAHVGLLDAGMTADGATAGAAAAGGDALAAAQQRIRDGLGPAAAAGDSPPPGPADGSGEAHTHADGFSHTHGAGAPATWTVRYTADGAFVPARLDIATGDEVVFVNDSAAPTWPASNIHPSHEILPEFDPLEAIDPGESWAFTFRRNGYWRYHNHIRADETGLIVAAAGPSEALAPLDLAEPAVSFEPVPPGAGGEALLDDPAALERFVLAHGPAAAVAELKAVELATGRDCHAAAHEVGHVAYEHFGAAAFRLGAHDCHSGVLHGTIESLIAERGTSRLAEDVAVLCSAAGNAFQVHQCYHGVGHGLLAWTSYELPEALELCDLMPAYADRDACYGGAHMENGVGGLSGRMGHTTEYLDRARPHFPCDVLPEHHVPGCYFWQTSNLFWFGYEAPEVAELCFEAPAYAHEACWWSMGRDLGSLHRDSPVTAASHCELADSVEHLTDCFQGAALSRFTEAANAAFSADLCDIADADHPPEVAEGCWAMVLRDAPHILGDAAGRREFCDSLTTPLRRDDCTAALEL